MATPVVILAFLVSLAVTLAAAAFFADKLDHVGPRLRIPEAIVGLLTAIAADAPEISSAIVALARGEKEVSLGVVLGASVFNFATMIGLSAILAGTIAVGRRSLSIEGTFALAAVLVAAGVVLGAFPPWLGVAAFAAGTAPYLVAVTRRPATHHAHRRHEGAVWKSAALIIPAVLLIVLGSIGMVRSAVVLADRWHVSKALVGLVLLGVLTSLPNAFTGVRLGLARRGEALVSETFGSNTINLVGGVLLPALVVGLAARSTLVTIDFAWLLATTCIAIALLARGIGRLGGAFLIVLYAIFVAVQVAYT
jgi:cation:H+ antiporter